MAFVDKIRDLDKLKFSFGKSSDLALIFNQNTNVLSMYSLNFGLGIPSNLSLENQLRAVFRIVNQENGVFLFNISHVDLAKAKKGFVNFNEAYESNMITEWELSVILQNPGYLSKTIFHNGSLELRLTNNGIKIKWN